MKIALVILHADPARGGAERYTFDLSQALVARGHAVTLIAATFGPRPIGVNCIELGESGHSRVGRYKHFLDSIEAHLSSGAYDIIHAMLPVRRCDVYHPHAGIAAQAIATGHLKHAGPIKRALAWFANQFNPRRNAFAGVERKLLTSNNPPVVLCLSDYVKEMVRRNYPNVPENRLATLFNAVDLTKYDPRARPGAGDAIRQKYHLAKDDIVALMVAQDFGRKGLSETIMALGQIHQPNLNLLVAGKDNIEPFKRNAIRNGVDARVKFAGGTNDVHSFYAAADFFVLPTRHDPCSLVVLEALAMGVPIISTKQNGACEIMTPGVHGFVLPSADDASGLTHAMKELCNPALREQMKQACLTLRPRLAQEAHLDALCPIYETCCPPIAATTSPTAFT